MRSGQTIVQCSAGDTDPIPMTVGLHQGSALSPLLFAIVMDTISFAVREGVPDELLYADESKNLQECDTTSPTVWYGSPCTEKIRRETA